MYENHGKLIEKIIHYTDTSFSYSDNNQEILIKSIFVWKFDYYDECKNIIILDYIHSNLSKTDANPHYRINAFMNDFKLEIHKYWDFYSETLPPGKKAKNQLSFLFDEFWTLELHIFFDNPNAFEKGITKILTLNISP